MITIAFFNNKGGVGKTSLVAHLSWMIADRGLSVLAVDLDPQSNLSSMMLTEERLQELWQGKQTLWASVFPFMDRSGDIEPVHVEVVTDRLHLLVGDLGLSRFEDLLAESWGKCLDGDMGAFRVMSAFHRLMRGAADRIQASVVLIDLGPNLGSLNRAGLLSSDNIVLPLAPDLFSIQGMQNLGPTLREWRRGWEKRRREFDEGRESLDLPKGSMQAIGYVLMNFGVLERRPVKAYGDWIDQIPGVYRKAVLGQRDAEVPTPDADPFRLAALKHYRSLMPLAMAAHKPMFMLKAADGARGAHLDAVRTCYDDFKQLAQRLGAQVGVAVP